MIREATIEDAAGAAALRALVYPELVVTPEALAFRMRTAPDDARRRWWCCEEGGTIAGWATAGLVVETSAHGVLSIDLDVHPDRRGRGVGTALLEQVEEHARAIGGRRVFVWSRGDTATAAFARAHDYRLTATSQMLVVDPRAVDAPGMRGDVELLPFAAFASDPSPVYDADAATVVDEPHEVTIDSLDYDLWLERWWRNPLVDMDASMAAVDGDRVVSLTWVHADRARGRGSNNGTGTLRSHRGRGLAQLTKRASLARAAELGLSSVYTGNDATNAPMLAVNRKLGYAPCSTMCTWAKELRPVTSSG